MSKDNGAEMTEGPKPIILMAATPEAAELQWVTNKRADKVLKAGFNTK